jgi:hypothetical protein
VSEEEQALYLRRSEALRDETLALAAGYAEQLARKLRSIEQDGIAECDVYEAIELARTVLPLLEAIY